MFASKVASTDDNRVFDLSSSVELISHAASKIPESLKEMNAGRTE
jgi:hypothetical protein